MNALTTLGLLSPEILLLITALAVLTLDLIWHGERRTGWLPYLAVAGTLAAIVATLAIYGRGESILGEMMAADDFALFFKLVALSATALVILGARQHIAARARREGEFYFLLLSATLASMLATAATDLISLYLAFEFLSLASYVLVSYLRGDDFSVEGGIKYFLYGAVASAIMLYGMTLLYGATGTTTLRGIAEGLNRSAGPLASLAIPISIMLLAGFAFKIAIAPFHQWAPDAYEGAPTPVTAYLSVASKMTGFAVLLRVMVVGMGDFQPTWARVLGAFAIVSMVLGNLVALQQPNIKRMLAYSSIAHAGYIMVGFVTHGLDPVGFTGLNGVLFYAMVYVFTNVGLFLGIIAFENATDSTKIADFAGLFRRSPVLAISMCYFLFSLTGIPFTGGMFAKIFVFGPAMQAGPFGLLLAGIGVVTSVVGAYYYLNVVRTMFFVAGDASAPAVPVGRLVQIGLVAAAVVTLAIGVFPQPLVDLASRSAVVLGMLP
ncbi:MAG: NADH-quinone oxidoreductase subunit N [Anaerolineae bacterium]|nr:NADH-quinone oxidoreductase subunit N [Anaerolineae bacterium]